MASTYTYNHSPTSIASLIDHTNQHQIQHSIDPTTRDSKANTPSSPAPPDQIPVVVFYPISTAETSILLKACNERRIAVTSFGAGTSFGGALAAVCGGVCVSFEEMKSVVKLNADDMDVVVQPGLGWMDLSKSKCCMLMPCTRNPTYVLTPPSRRLANPIHGPLFPR